MEEIAEIIAGKGGASLEIFLISGECFSIFTNGCRQIYAMLNAFLREAGPPGKMQRIVSTYFQVSKLIPTRRYKNFLFKC